MSSKKGGNSNKTLDLDSVFCIACRCIYIRPVTMPCEHTLCLECFKNMVNITAYQCPTCRRRISNWLRQFKNDWDSIVNENLWKAIQQQYPVEVKKRLNDEDDGLEERIVGQGITHVQNEEGEIKKEFDEMRMLFLREEKKTELQNVELAKRLEEEEKANWQAREKLNKKIVQEDMELASTIQENLTIELQQEQTLFNESDEQLAKQLQHDMSLEINESIMNTNIKNKKLSSKKNNHKKGPLDKLFSTLNRKEAEIHDTNKKSISLCSSSTSSSPSTSLYSSTSSIIDSNTLPSTSSYSSTSSFTNSSTSVFSVTDSNTISEHENLDTCVCGRLKDNFNSEVPPCQFCIAQIALFNKLKTQQYNDFKIAKKLERELNRENEYNLRKRRKLSKGQRTLIQSKIWEKFTS